MIKHKLFFNPKKEEEWLEKLRMQRYQLINVRTWTCRYEFRKVNNQDDLPVVKIDYRNFKKRDEFENYIAMFEDSGWKHIAGTKSSVVQYFERSNSAAGDDIFSDAESKAGFYKRISNLWFEMFAVYCPLAIIFQTQGLFNFRSIFHLKELYYTPGLWEMDGAEFWSSFLFETPFALMRGLSTWLFLLIILMYAWFGIKSLYWCRKEKEKM